MQRRDKERPGQSFRKDGPPGPRSDGRPYRGGGNNKGAGYKPGAPKPSTAPRGAPPRDEPGIKNPYVRFRPLKKPPVALHETTLWDYPSQHYGKGEQGSQGYRGATPSHIIWNVIQRHTKENDLVVDPFCGSGTTLDVCRDTKRRGRGFDIAPFRSDIEQADARRLPVDDSTVHLVFMDPPYADNLTYSDDPNCIGKLNAVDGSWHDAMARAIGEARRMLRLEGVLAIFVCDIFHSKGGDQAFHALGLDLASLAARAGLVMMDHIAVVRHGKALEGHAREHAQRDGFLLRGFSHLMLFQKVTEGPTSQPKPRERDRGDKGDRGGDRANAPSKAPSSSQPQTTPPPDAPPRKRMGPLDAPRRRPDGARQKKPRQ